MSGSLRQFAHCLDHVFAPQSARLGKWLAYYQLGQCGSASHGGNAAFCSKSNIADRTGFDFRGQPKHIAADGIRYFRHGIGIREVASVSRILKMIQNLGGIHKPCDLQVTSAFGKVNHPSTLAG